MAETYDYDAMEQRESEEIQEEGRAPISVKLTGREIESLLTALERSTEMSGDATLDRDEKTAAAKLLRAFDPGDSAGLALIRMDTRE